MKSEVSYETEKRGNEILYLSFNQEGNCFAVGTDIGFKIFNSNPLKLITERNLGSGIGKIEMLYRTNILALVGDGKNSHYSTKKVIIWDDHQEKPFGELKFRTNIKNIKMKSDK